MHRTTLSKALKQATDDGLIPHNGASPVKPPRSGREEIRPLDLEQVRALLEAARGERLEALCVVAVTAGLQRGELQGLKWEDVDLEANTLQARRTLSEPKGGYIFETPKRSGGTQYPTHTEGYNGSQGASQAPTGGEVEHGALWQDHGLVFPSGIGTPLLCGNLNRAFKAALRRAGLPEIRFHDLRYSCATLLLRQGVNL